METVVVNLSHHLGNEVLYRETTPTKRITHYEATYSQSPQQTLLRPETGDEEVSLLCVTCGPLVATIRSRDSIRKEAAKSRLIAVFATPILLLGVVPLALALASGTYNPGNNDDYSIAVTLVAIFSGFFSFFCLYEVVFGLDQDRPAIELQEKDKEKHRLKLDVGDNDATPR